MSDLLLHSLAEFRQLILGSLDLVGARYVVEIGGEGGIFTQELLSWAERHEARICCIDPAPSDVLVGMMQESAVGELRRDRSITALAEMEPADVYLVDGDHNHYTVSHELRAIEAATGDRYPLVFLHDVGWPWGRRDLYYDPQSIPADARHPYSYEKGVTVGVPGVVDYGFRGEGEFACALEEGGPANGVLTAVEEFLADHPELELRRVPCIFGLGVLHATDAPYAADLTALLAPYEDNPLLARLEENRLTLYLRVLQIQQEMERALEESALRLRDLEVENRALWARVHELDTVYQALAGEVDTMIRARSFAVAEGLSRLHGRLGETHGVSRQRLRALLDSSGSPTGAVDGRPGTTEERTAPRPVR